MARPRPPRPRRRRLRLTTLGRLVVTFLAALVVGLLAAGGLLQAGLAQLDRSVVAGLVNRAQAAEAEADTPAPSLLNVLVVGSDSRDGLTQNEVRRLHAGHADGARTDTLMLLQLELNGEGRGAVLSFPRDLLVTRCDGTEGRINAAYGVGLELDGDGPSCLVKTVSRLTGVQIHHYVELDFAGFVDVIDTLGGVGLYLEKPIADRKAGIDLPAGCVRLTGRDALGFVRVREPDSDFGRIARQQRFIKEALREATGRDLLTDPAKLLQVVDAAAGAVRTDENLGLAGMRDIALGLRRLTAGGLEVYTVPSEAQLRGGVWYVVEHEQQADALYSSFRTGSVVRDGPPPTEQPTRPPLAPVTVLNATGQTGLAAAAAEMLEGEGFTVVEIGDDTTDGLDVTRILHAPAHAADAAQLARLFPSADVVQGVDSLPLTVKVGADFVPAAASPSTEAATERPTEGPSDPTTGRASAATPPPTYLGASITDVDC